MVRAILREQNPKTCTRRVIKPQPSADVEYMANPMPNLWFGYRGDSYAEREVLTGEMHCPYGRVGSPLWVRETYYYETHMESLDDDPPDLPDGRYRRRLVYRADNPDYPVKDGVGPNRWTPSIHMPRWASRITLEVTDIRAEQLQDISEEEAIMEGIEPLGSPYLGRYRDYHQLSGEGALCARDSFASLWDTINHDRGFGWWVNPWVWAISFKVLQA
jgi:hypothetical protein